jgi:hypothetical protein
MDEYETKFLELLSCAKYIKDEKVKIQCILIRLPQSFKDEIEFDEP